MKGLLTFASIAVMAIGLIGCRADGVDGGAGFPELEVVPEPPLDDLEEEVRGQIKASGIKIRLLRNRDGTSREELAWAYGEHGKRLLAYKYTPTAEVAFDNATRLAPDPYRWWYYLGVTRRIQGDFEGARQAFEATLERRPSDVPALVSLAETEIHRGEPDLADELALRALTIDSRTPTAFYLRGRVAVERGDFEAAAELFEEALALQPLASIIRYPLASAYRRVGRVDDARAQLARRGSRLPSLADPLMREVEALVLGTTSHLVSGSQAMREDRVEAALIEFRAARDQDPDNATARLNLGAVLARLGRFEEAIPELEEAVILDLTSGSRSKACFNLGVLYGMQGRVDEAKEQFRSALKWDPSNIPAQQHLARLESIES